MISAMIRIGRGEPIQEVNPSVKLQRTATQLILSLRNLRMQEAKQKKEAWPGRGENPRRPPKQVNLEAK
jgi:hypothetical protein